MPLATYKAPYALRNIINQDPSIMATPQPKAEELAYAVAGEQAGIEAQAAQREEDISLKKLALAQKAEQAKESIQLKREALEDYEKGSKQALAFSTVGAGINTMRGYMQAEKTAQITSKISDYFQKQDDFQSRMDKHWTSQAASLKDSIATQRKARPDDEMDTPLLNLRKRWSEGQ